MLASGEAVPENGHTEEEVGQKEFDGQKDNQDSEKGERREHVNQESEVAGGNQEHNNGKEDKKEEGQTEEEAEDGKTEGLDEGEDEESGQNQLGETNEDPNGESDENEEGNNDDNEEENAGSRNNVNHQNSEQNENGNQESQGDEDGENDENQEENPSGLVVIEEVEDNEEEDEEERRRRRRRRRAAEKGKQPISDQGGLSITELNDEDENYHLDLAILKSMCDYKCSTRNSPQPPSYNTQLIYVKNSIPDSEISREDLEEKITALEKSFNDVRKQHGDDPQMAKTLQQHYDISD